MDKGMSFVPLTWSDLLLMAPELTLAAMFVVLIILDLLLPKRLAAPVLGWLTLATLLLSLALVILQIGEQQGWGGASQSEITSLLHDSYRVDAFGGILKIVFLLATAFVVLLMMGVSTGKSKGASGNEAIVSQRGEFFYLLLPAAMGAMMMASSGNMVTLFIGLELLSLTSYILVGMKRGSTRSAEAAFKYVVIGGVASAFVLFGMSYLYGVTGDVSMAGIGAALPGALETYESLIYVGFGMIVAGIAIKIAAAPFHAWAPDVYEGAPAPVAAFLAVVAKGAALAVLFRFLYNTLLVELVDEGVLLADDIMNAVLIVAAASMLVGVVAALRQVNVRRLLALSGTVNAGYLLVPLAMSITVMNSSGFAQLVFYLMAYLFMTMGAFAVLTVVGKAAGHEQLDGWAKGEQVGGVAGREQTESVVGRELMGSVVGREQASIARREQEGSIAGREQTESVVGQEQLGSFAGMYHRSPWTAVAMVVFVLSLAGLPVTGGFFGKLFILLGAAGAREYGIVAVMAMSTVIAYYFYFRIIRQMFMRNGNEKQPIVVPVTTGAVIWLCAGATIVMGLFPTVIMGAIEMLIRV